MTCFASSGYAADLLSATIVKASIYINNTNQTQSLDEPIKIYI
ncbi:hypothetical protein PaecuDRAFT_4637 [Paenibacillus curdlanolyticus YK9]|uniref:Uncharacterized protein n=1 Tax=Paenibacillus curdlanolyticus YK9 TaxID=717606 RepID=E0IG46_9BACL|nr:hypothetical protein PaecuDRAFT_4637 [Paenibacillus curdlanolyticus YK9]